MKKNALGELKLSPIKEEGRFIFINDEIRLNGKLNKGDYIKIQVESFEVAHGVHYLKNKPATALMVVRGKAHHITEMQPSASVEEAYEKIAEMYRNQFYFGQMEI